MDKIEECPQLSYAGFQEIINNISYKDDWWFRTGNEETSYWLQVNFFAPCKVSGNMVRQACAKQRVSQFATTDEVVKTALKACLLAEEHEARESFEYKGVAIYGPHFSPDELVTVLQGVTQQKRQQAPSQPLQQPLRDNWTV